MPQPRKASDRRQNRVTKDVGRGEATGMVPTGSPRGIDSECLPSPVPPVPLKAKTRKYWETFWRSPVAQVVDPDIDAFLILRWITYVDDWFEATATLKSEGRYVEGSTGQKVAHPAEKTRQWLDGAIGAIEKELGLTPKARATLGLAVNQYKKSAADLIDDIRSMPPVAIED